MPKTSGKLRQAMAAEGYLAATVLAKASGISAMTLLRMVDRGEAKCRNTVPVETKRRGVAQRHERHVERFIEVAPFVARHEAKIAAMKTALEQYAAGAFDSAQVRGVEGKLGEVLAAVSGWNGSDADYRRVATSVRDQCGRLPTAREWGRCGHECVAACYCQDG